MGLRDRKSGKKAEKPQAEIVGITKAENAKSTLDKKLETLNEHIKTIKANEKNRFSSEATQYMDSLVSELTTYNQDLYDIMLANEEAKPAKNKPGLFSKDHSNAKEAGSFNAACELYDSVNGIFATLSKQHNPKISDAQVTQLNNAAQSFHHASRHVFSKEHHIQKFNNLMILLGCLVVGAVTGAAVGVLALQFATMFTIVAMTTATAAFLGGMFGATLGLIVGYFAGFGSERSVNDIVSHAEPVHDVLHKVGDPDWLSRSEIKRQVMFSSGGLI